MTGVSDVAALVDPVSDIIREVSAEIIEPRFRALRPDQVSEKAPGDLVTVADREAEAALAKRFGELLPGVAVVGEESASANPEVLGHLTGDGPAWVIDPIDGTKNFVNGSVDHAVMVALIDGRQTVAAWIWYPTRKLMLTTSTGMGVRRNGEVVSATPRPGHASKLSGIVKTGFAPELIRAALKRRQAVFAGVSRGRACAGVEYGEIVEGRVDFMLYWLVRPWDHLPGSLLVTELGGRAAHLDGTPYLPDSRQAGLLVAATPELWATARKQLFG